MLKRVILPRILHQGRVVPSSSGGRLVVPSSHCQGTHCFTSTTSQHPFPLPQVALAYDCDDLTDRNEYGLLSSGGPKQPASTNIPYPAPNGPSRSKSSAGGGGGSGGGTGRNRCPKVGWVFDVVCDCYLFF